MSYASIPSPSQGVWHLGPVPVRAYALCIILGVIVAVWVAQRRYAAIGGRPSLILDVATWAVPFGLVGARLYHVITDYELYFGAGKDPLNAFKIWDGGIGIPGAISLGALGAWIACRRAGVALGPVAGAAAPGIALAQAIGRWGNWFNQELFGRPSSLPWALEISPQHRPAGFENVATYQPTFLYESLWDIGIAVLVIWAAKRFLLTGDRIFALYVAAYGVGRFIIESLRIDFAHRILGLRVNQWMAVLIFAIGVVYLIRTRYKIGPDVVTEPDQDRAVGSGEAAGSDGTGGGDATSADGDATAVTDVGTHPDADDQVGRAATDSASAGAASAGADSASAGADSAETESGTADGQVADADKVGADVSGDEVTEASVGASEADIAPGG